MYFSLFSSLHLSNSGCLCLYVSSAVSVRCLSWDLLQPGGVCGSLQQSELTGEGRSLPFVSWTCPPVEAATVHVLVLLWSPEMLLWHVSMCCSSDPKVRVGMCMGGAAVYLLAGGVVLCDDGPSSVTWHVDVLFLLFPGGSQVSAWSCSRPCSRWRGFCLWWSAPPGNILNYPGPRVRRSNQRPICHHCKLFNSHLNGCDV